MKNKFLDRTMFYNLLFKLLNAKAELSLDQILALANATFTLELEQVSDVRDLCLQILKHKTNITLDDDLSNFAIVNITVNMLQNYYGDIVKNNVLL